MCYFCNLHAPCLFNSDLGNRQKTKLFKLTKSANEFFLENFKQKREKKIFDRRKLRNVHCIHTIQLCYYTNVRAHA